MNSAVKVRRTVWVFLIFSVILLFVACVRNNPGTFDEDSGRNPTKETETPTIEVVTPTEESETLTEEVEIPTEEPGREDSGPERVAKAFVDALFAQDCVTALTYVDPERGPAAIDSICPNPNFISARIDDVDIDEESDPSTGQPYWVVTVLGEFVAEVDGSIDSTDSMEVTVKEVDGKYYVFPWR